MVNDDIKDWSPLQKDAQTDRIRSYFLHDKVECDFNMVRRALDGEPEENQEVLVRTLAMQKADAYLEKRVKSIDMAHLKKCHEIFLRGSKDEKFGGILRYAQGKGYHENYLPPQNEELEGLLNNLITFINDRESKQHPMVRGWAVYLLFDIVQPFVGYNQTLSLLVRNQLMNHWDYGFNSIAVFEKYLFKDWSTHQSVKFNSLFPLNYSDRMDTDVTAFFENCAGLSAESMTQVEEAILKQLKIDVGYNKLSPIKKNSFNYFFELGLPKHYKEIGGLHDRQKSILKDVIFNRSVTTKQMVMKYRCDRKTIQRDFSDLMEVGIVIQEGKTKTINYHPSFR